MEKLETVEEFRIRDLNEPETVLSKVGVIIEY
jgi:hypothetical protein